MLLERERLIEISLAIKVKLKGDFYLFFKRKGIVCVELSL